MRLFYTFMWWLALPLVLGRLWWRGRKEPGYRQHWGERLGMYGARAANDEPATIWVHAVSVGETRAAEPLVDALLKKYPQARIVLTCMTPTGRATGKSLFGKHGARVVQSYLPYDMPLLVARFIRHFEPRICILMETEVWPNLILQCQRDRVPVVLANARLSERSLGKAQRFGKVIRDAAQGITLVAAQTEADALRIRELGASNVSVTGSIKFDVVIPQAALATGAQLRQQFGVRPVFLCASTREGEEGMILEAFLAARASLPQDVLLLIVPRHPQRFDEVAAMVTERGLSLQRRSELAGPGASVAFHRCGAGRFDGRNVRLLLRLRPGLHRRQPAAAGRPEPDRTGCTGQADHRRRAHFQLRASNGRLPAARRGRARAEQRWPDAPGGAPAGRQRGARRHGGACADLRQHPPRRHRAHDCIAS